MREFFSDIYGFDAIEQGLVRKDPAIFPAFSQDLILDAREQTLRVLSAHLLEDDGDYRELFTTRRSFLTRRLGLVYRVPVRSADGWEPYEFPEDSRRAGLLTHASLLALHSHPGRSSPTLRGKFIREAILCQDVPPPPGNIDFSMFADDAARKEMFGRAEAGGLGYGDVKKDLLARMLDTFAAMREGREELAKRPDDVEDILADGARRARALGKPQLEAARSAAGLGPPR